MESLFERQRSILQSTSTDIVRGFFDTVNWSAPMLCIRGARGVGKSTLLRQYIKIKYGASTTKALYCSLDWVYFTQHSMYEVASSFYKSGGELIIFDEVHKYDGWSREAKEIADVYPSMQIFLSGSSLLNLLVGDADLSRRCRNYNMPGLSFREFLRFYKGIEIPIYSLQQVIDSADQIAELVNQKCRPLEFFHEYLKYGYYPYYFSNQMDYYTLVEQTVNYVIEVELPQLRKVDVQNCRKLKSLLTILAQQPPYEVDIAKLGTLTQLQRNTIIEYLRHLSDSDIISLLYSDISSIKRLQKPDKIYLDNPNLLYALAITPVKIGTVRECFAVNQLSYSHRIEYGKEHGDFKVDGKLLFEVGGQGKSFEQIADLPDSYILADDIEYPIGKKLPLWLIGLLY